MKRLGFAFMMRLGLAFLMRFVHNLICMSRRPTTAKALSSDFVHKIAHKGTGTRANAHDGLQYRISLLFTSRICGSFLTSQAPAVRSANASEFHSDFVCSTAIRRIMYGSYMSKSIIHKW